MNDIYDTLNRLSASGGIGVLAEIVSTAGSTPRKAGARMLLSPDGSFSGTVGGGALEYYAQKDALEALAAGRGDRKTYSLAGADARGRDIGAICGGSATIEFRPLDGAGAEALLKTMPRPPRVLLYGAGHVGKALADALHLLSIPVTVTDERDALLTEERFPHAERRLCPLPEAVMEPLPQDMIVIMTHGHAHDYDLARRALLTPAAYIGVMASRRKAAIFRERLGREGFSPQELEKRLHCPIGLPIRAETPEELAVSITAEMIALMHPEKE